MKKILLTLTLLLGVISVIVPILLAAVPPTPPAVTSAVVTPPTAGFDASIANWPGKVIWWNGNPEFFEIYTATSLSAPSSEWTFLSAHRQAPRPDTGRGTFYLCDARRSTNTLFYIMTQITRERWIAYDSLPPSTNFMAAGLFITE
jgi:hypothetical protein